MIGIGKMARINKKYQKRIDKECYICGENNLNVLDCHRIIHGKVGGKYTTSNTCTICVKCHRKTHADPPQITILGWKMSTKGRMLHYIEDGVEKFK